MAARSISDRGGSHFYRLLLLLLDYSITGPAKDNLYLALSGPRVEGLSRLSTLDMFFIPGGRERLEELASGQE